MATRITKREVENTVASAGSKPETIEYLGALLGRAVGEDVVIVGGSAIEIHTSGRTASADIDVIGPRASAIEAVESWGFVRAGRIWRREDWGIDFDFLGEHMTGSRSKTVLRETPYGPVRVLGYEDSLVKRFVELKYWPTAPDWRADLIRQIQFLLEDYGDSLDEEYLAFVAKRDGVVDILADFRERRSRSVERRDE